MFLILCCFFQLLFQASRAQLRRWATDSDAGRNCDSMQREFILIGLSVFLQWLFLEKLGLNDRTKHEFSSKVSFSPIFWCRVRWCLYLSKPDFDIMYKADIKHQVANALSQLLVIDDDDRSLENELPFLWIKESCALQRPAQFIDA